MGSITRLYVLSLSLLIAHGVIQPSQALAQMVQWAEVAVQPQESELAAVYDSVRHRVVAFGGDPEIAGSPSQTAEWDGASWTMRTVAGPTSRHGHCMAFDSHRGVAVLFGGATIDGSTDETWEWNGEVWSMVNLAPGAVRPSARRNASMTYDSVRQVTVLFGGDTNAGPSQETWEWNGASWALRSNGGPSRRSYSAMAFDSIRQVAVLFGGADLQAPDGSPVVNAETWEWNGVLWTQRALTPAAAPSPRGAHAMVFDSVRMVTVLFGGAYVASASSPPTTLGETWEWNGLSWIQRSVDSPEPRNSHVMAYDADRQVTVMFGREGDDSDPYFTGVGTWEWNGSIWTLRIGRRPPARGFPALAFDSHRGVSVMFGGQVNFGDVYGSDTWERSGGGWSRRSITGPVARAGAVLAYDSGRRVSVLFGGSGVVNGLDVRFNDTWEWDGNGWVQRNVAVSPPAMWERAMAFDSHRGRTVLFGRAESDFSRQTWEWDGSSWLLRTASGPFEFGGTVWAMAYDSVRHVTVLVGTNVGPHLETWEWNGSTWELRATNGPTSRILTAMAFDASRGVTVLYGGYDQLANALFGDTWEWNGVTWTQRLGSGPPAREAHAMCYDSIRRSVVVYAGLNRVTGLGDTWELAATFATRCQPADIADDQGNPLPAAPGVPNSGVNEGDFNAFFQGFFDALLQCDIADDQGTALPPFDTGGSGGVPNSGVNEGDYNCFFQFFFNGCP